MIYFLQKNFFYTLAIPTVYIYLILFVFVSQVLACSCKWGRAPADVLKSSDVVFLGEVTDIKVVEDHNSWFDDFPDDGSFFLGSSYFQHDMKVEKSWKGVREKTIRIGTWEDGAACGIGSLEIGQRMLIYASKPPEPLTFWERMRSFFKKPIRFVSLCSRKKSGKAIKEEAKILDALLEESPP